MQINNLDQYPTKICHSKLEDRSKEEIQKLHDDKNVKWGEENSLGVKDSELWSLRGAYDRVFTVTKNGKKIVYDDYGILGLGFKPGPSCVISYYRMARNIPMFSRTVVHEYMHTLGVPHCEHKHCLMQDGKGSGKNMRESTHVHSECKHIALKGLH